MNSILSVLKNVNPAIALAITGVELVADLIQDEDPEEIKKLVAHDPESGDYKDRMKEELAELETRLVKINEFLDGSGFDKIPVEAQVRIMNQRGYMMRYAKTLKVRIERD